MNETPHIRCSIPDNRRNKTSLDKMNQHPTLKGVKNVRWVRERSPEKLIKKSVNAFYEQNLNKIIVKPEYLFAETNMIHLNKLKDLFREFDQDFSQTLELKEIEGMFRQNNICLNTEEIRDLFFNLKSKNTNKKSYLDFHSLVDSAISTNTDEKYRLYMRNLKSQGLSSNNFFPMNFSALLEHINDKGKIRRNINSVDESIKKINKFLTIEPEKINIFEQDKNIHKNISFSKIIDNFHDIVKISAKKLPQIKSTKRKSVFELTSTNIQTNSLPKNGNLTLNNTNSLYNYYIENKIYPFKSNKMTSDSTNFTS